MDILAIVVPNALFLAVPLIITALGGVISERAGIVNIGLEGLMIMGAFVGIVTNLTLAPIMDDGAKWVALLAATLASSLFAILHAVASITFRADQVISGVAINFLALGIGLFAIEKLYGKGQTDSIDVWFNKTSVPYLSDIPILGPLFFQSTYATNLVAFVLVIIVWFVLFYTPFGLRLRAVGEHPTAADTMGINVTRMRYIAVIISGALGGLGGGIFAQTVSLNFSNGTISGQGFMALAAMIFGKWHPLGAMGAALFFGLAQSLVYVQSQVPWLEAVPKVVLDIAPYVLTILALAGFIGRATAPKALNTPYVKGSR